ncbi:PREDICTED: beta-microseminoprotein-like [Elephantulus edwardii]|uniref:beta-microseminoprotein-like n=1 Tax=Elephantulus edwardii TaxID=28737 RepID=UPI0003F06344|nr:PREDICTED: beta-microseminoprotein-like [Elephantulus edwardii]
MECQKGFLGTLVVLATFVVSCNAYCYIIPIEKVSGKSTTECKDDNGIMHPMNTAWETEKCERCSCWRDGIQCCSIISTPVGYNSDKCKKIFHQENCSYTVVEKDNPHVNCDVDSWIM